MEYDAVVIGTSLGGLNALTTILSALPHNFPLPVIIVQHVAASSDGYWIKMLDTRCALNVKEADEKEQISAGNVYVAPSNYHLLIEIDRTLSLSAGERVNYARPAIDVLFETAADAYEKRLIGIILTGASKDGTAGMQKIKHAGGLTVAQDPSTAEAPFMPASAIKEVEIDHVLTLKSIVSLLLKI